jgi:hypothetical protein
LTNIITTTNAVAMNQSACATNLANQGIKNPHKGCPCFDASDCRQIAKHDLTRQSRNEQYYGDHIYNQLDNVEILWFDPFFGIDKAPDLPKN